MFSSYYLFLFTFLSLTLLCTCSSSLSSTRADVKSSPDLISNICSETLNAAYCLEFLRPLYHSGKSLHDLARDTIRSSKTFLLLVYDEIHVREKETIRDPELNDKYHRCGVQYTSAINGIIQSINLLQSGDYQKLPALASLALKQTESCDMNFTPPGSEPSDFKSLNEKARDVCSVVLAVFKHLVSGKS